MMEKIETKLEVGILQRKANWIAQCGSFSAYGTIVVATSAYFYLDGSGTIEQWARTSTEEPCVHSMTLDEAIPSKIDQTITATRTAVRVSKSAFQALINQHRSE